MQSQKRTNKFNRGCPDGGIGRRAGLKHQWSNIHPGSIPGLGTDYEDKQLVLTAYPFSFFRGFSFVLKGNMIEALNWIKHD